WSKDGQTVAWGHRIADRQNLNGNLRPLARSFNLSSLEFERPPDSSFLRARFRDDSIRVEVLDNFSTTPRVVVKKGGDTVTEFRAEGQVYCCTLLPNNRVAVGGHRLALYDTRNGKKLQQFAGGTADDLAPSPDGRYLLATGSLASEHRLNVWSLDR